MITSRDLAVVKSVAHYYTLTRAQITRLHFPEDPNGRITRKRLQLLLDAHLLGRTRMQVVNPVMGAPAPVYYPSEQGCAFLAQEFRDPRYLAACTHTPTWQHLYHWVQVAETHILLDLAVGLQTGVSVAEWINEWAVANADEERPDKRFRLFTLLRESPRLVCAPDAAFLLDKDGYRKVFYLEQDRDTTKSAFRVAASKHAGYASLFEQHLHRRHFPTANVEKFTVLMIAPTAQRRDALRNAMRGKPGDALWKFASLTDLTPQTFLTAPVFHPCSSAASPLLLPSSGGAR